MLQKDNRDRLLEVFFQDPHPQGEGYQLRELSRMVNIAPLSVKNYLDEFVKEEIIITRRSPVNKFPLYWGNLGNNDFKFLKKQYTMKTLVESGLITLLSQKFMADVILLFGSASRGEDSRGSDIDLYIQSPEPKELPNLTKFESRLRRKINLLIRPNFKKISEELKNNLLNGVILFGYLKVF